MPIRDLLAAALSDRYRIERELGSGGFATVYQAHDLRHERPVALKVLHEEVALSLGKERFEREIKLAARLQHPHILGVFDSGEDAGQLWFAMPFIAGESLRDKLTREQQLPVADAVGIAREVADALHHAHEQGVLHRDIKPENILLSGRHAMVADFGIARAIREGAEGSLTRTGMSVGTPGYMSPEQAAGERTLDARTDIYALACVLYEMLAGEPPFTGPNAQTVIARTLTETPRRIAASRAGVPDALDDVLARALSKTPADRPASAEAFADELTDAIRVSTGTVPVATGAAAVGTAASTTAPMLARRYRSNMAAVFALGLLLGLGALFAWRARSVDAAGRGVAVLPFENVGDAADAYFADGMTEELRGRLTSVPGLRVTARASSNQYKGSTKSPEAIGGELGVDFILTGTVRWEKDASGERHVRVTPELINAATGTMRWQQSYDEVISDVFRVQSDIAGKVASTLGMTLATDVQARLSERPTSNAAAYEEYLLGEKETEAMARGDGASERNGLLHYERATALDTTFGLAWARASFIYSDFFSSNATEEYARRAEETLQKALKYAPDNAQVRRAYSRYLRFVKKDYAGASAQIDTGLMRQPNNADLLNSASGINALLGRFDAAVDYLRRAVQLDPRNGNIANSMARLLHGVRRYEESDEYSGKALALSPANIGFLWQRATNFISWRGDLPAARRVVTDGLKAGADSAELAAYFALYQEMMWVLDDPMLRSITLMPASRFFNNRQQWALKVGRTWVLLGDSAKGRAYGDTSRVAVEAQLASYPEDAQLHELHGRALVLAGRYAEAIAEAEQSLKMRETALDATTGPYVRYQVARILIQAKAYDRALDIIEPLLTMPYADITPAWLRTDPVFQPLRGNPRFDRMAKGG